MTIVTVALSRSVVKPWTPGLELQYGYLALLIPVAAWLVISCWCRHPVAEPTAAVVVLALVAYMYQANSSWRIATSRQAYPVVVAAELALMGAAPPLQVAGDHMSEFYYVDTPEARGSVANDIVVLRRLPLWHADGTVQP